MLLPFPRPFVSHEVMSYVRVRQGTNVTPPNNFSSPALATFSIIESQWNGCFDTSLYQWKPPAGVVWISCVIEWQSTSGNAHAVWLRKNGQTIAQELSRVSTAYQDTLHVTAHAESTGGDVFDCVYLRWNAGFVSTNSFFMGVCIL